MAADPGERAALRALFATDGCAVSLSLALLTGQECEKDLYIVSYAWGAALSDVFGIGGESPEPGDEEPGPPCPAELAEILVERRPAVEFSLLGHLPGAPSTEFKERTRPVFICEFPSPEAARALARALLLGEPLPGSLIAACIDHPASMRFHEDMILALYLRADAAALALRAAPADASGPSRACVDAVLRRPRDRRGLLQLYIHHEQLTIAAYRRLYGNYMATPFWFLSKFGPAEKSLVLATRYYLFQSDECRDVRGYDLQAVKDFISTYDVSVPANPSRLGPQDLVSFSALSRFCARSHYARGAAAARLPQYVSARVRADLAEVSLLSGYIVHDRQGLRVSDSEFIAYIYLAYFEGFNRKQLHEHLAAVTVRSGDDVLAIAGASRLGSTTVRAFFDQVRAQFNIRDYIANNVRPRVTVLSAACAERYADQCTYATLPRRPRGRAVAAYETAPDMRALLGAVDARLGARGWVYHAAAAPPGGGAAVPGDELPAPPQPGCCGIGRRLLAIAAAPPDPRAPVGPLNVFLGMPEVRGPVPVYRVALPSKHQAFAVVPQDDWDAVSAAADVSAADVERVLLECPGASPEARARRDMRLTDLCQLGGGRRTAPVGHAPLYVNRNELFNGDLAAANVILDVDFHTRRPVPLLTLFRAMRGFRAGIITALSILLPEARADWPAHPCYFFKSACPAAVAPEASLGGGNDPLDDWALEEELARDTGEALWDPDAGTSDLDAGAPPTPADTAPGAVCRCPGKVGFRVAVPVPPPYLLVGSETLRGAARILQQAVILERDFLELMSDYLADFSFVDTGVYAHGHSLRLPFFYKLSEWGQAAGRLLPFYVLPEACPDPARFVQEHRDPNRFHFHARPADADARTHVVHHLDGDYVTFFERKAERNKAQHFPRRTSLAAALGGFGVAVDREEDLVEFILTVALNEILQYLRAHFQDKADEYCSVRARLALRKPNWLLAQLLPGGGSSRAPGFACLRYNHLRGARDRARTFVSLGVDAHSRLCASLCQQCFATKCDSNQLKTIFAVELSPP
ncbi:helicase-primase primase subunit [Beluga whale alphaherpesvirus 1]|uniref:Helicase-primase primase subunit n=1 Tax=Beluga whale alphaherpesvirus 1 TaxID=1434720 RepID=A0A286RUF3_9ALPH|nr:helicase-primase primase subunit [Beluga whale alphaherpesvirus 1]ASW27053.1 helicase-primase primase subunit [Beluga whale alphaherpesvirus 1]